MRARKFYIRSHAHAHVLEVGPPYIFIFYLDYIGMDVITCFKVLAMIVLNKGISPGTELSMVEPQRQRRKYLQAAKFVFIFSLSFCLWSLSLMICFFH